MPASSAGIAAIRSASSATGRIASGAKDDRHDNVRLRVDPTAGAGLSLVWIRPEGYLIESVESWPGQPQLQVGDVIRAVGGVELGNLPSEDQADAALASAIGAGVLVRILRPSVDVSAGDVVRASAASKSAQPLWLPSVGLGTWSWGNDDFGAGAGRHSVNESFFKVALDRGSFFFDTAPTYGRGFAEDSLGQFSRTVGSFSIVATKYYPKKTDRDLASAMMASAEQSIRRLSPAEGCLDLFQLHRIADPPHSPEEQADALAAVVQAGYARAVGVCNCSVDELRVIRTRLLDAHGLALSTCQVEFSLARQLPAVSGLIAACREMGVVVLAYSPLAMGRLTGRFDPLRGAAPRWGRDGNRSRPFGSELDGDPGAMSQLLAAMKKIGQEHDGKTRAQVALNWVMCQGAIPLAGARSSNYATENAGAMGWRLKPGAVSQLTALGGRGSTSDFQHG